MSMSCSIPSVFFSLEAYSIVVAWQTTPNDSEGPKNDEKRKKKVALDE